MNSLNIVLLLVLLVVYFFGKKTITRFVKRIGKERSIAPSRIAYVNAAIVFAWTVLALVSAGIITGVNYRDLSFLLGSALALFGIALFAQWSILSNITASIIVFFFFPYRVGDLVEILDGENTVSGRIKEITLFHVIMQGDEDTLVTYPNSLVFQRAVKITRNKKHSLPEAKPSEGELENPSP